MQTRAITSGGDWTFGGGRADYRQRSAAISQSVVTRLRSFLDDWFADVDAGLPWLDMLGAKGNEARVLAEIERTVLETYGVRVITRLRLVKLDVNRAAHIELSYKDIFDTDYTDTVTLP